MNLRTWIVIVRYHNVDCDCWVRMWIVIVGEEGGWKQMAVCWQWRPKQETHWTHHQIGVAVSILGNMNGVGEKYYLFS